MPYNYCIFTCLKENELLLKYHLHPDLDRKPSVQGDKLILDISLQHLGIVILSDRQLVYLDIYALEGANVHTALDQISSIFSEHQWLQKSYAQVKVIYHTEGSILVPDKLYDAESNRDLLHWQFGDLFEMVPMNKAISKKGITLLYAVPEVLHHMVTANFPKAEFVHAHANLVAGELDAGLSTIHINVFPDEWICAFWKNGKLQLIRSIMPLSSDDICYMLINMCKQLDMLTSETVISLSGLLDKEDEVVLKLSRFFQNIIWNEIEGIPNYPTHYFAPLLNQSLCEL